MGPKELSDGTPQECTDTVRRKLPWTEHRYCSVTALRPSATVYGAYANDHLTDHPAMFPPRPRPAELQLTRLGLPRGHVEERGVHGGRAAERGCDHSGSSTAASNWAG